jgi:SAM-dependent methyltransferase
VLNVASLSELNKTTIKIYNTDIGGQLDTFFLNNKNYVRSVYPPHISLGTKIDDGVYCQDLEQLTFADESFDVIITEDVLEHVRHYEMAFKEIYRVLKPKGVHVFTVPIGLMQNTVIRVDTSGTEDIFLMPPEYHGDSLRNEGILAYRNFGKDTPELLKEFGFETSIETCANLAAKFGIYNSTVLISKKS